MSEWAEAEGRWLFMRALWAQYPGSTLKYAFIAHLFYWHCLNRGQHSNCSLPSCSRLKNRSSQVTWILSLDPHFSPAWQLSQVLCKYRELGRQMLTQSGVLAPRPFAKWLSFCGRRWLMRVREKIAPRTKWGVRVMNNKYIAWKVLGLLNTFLWPDFCLDI